nr:lethal(3)malignant brain tumor-like protein 3 isoform X1 [Leptinotarsa decemlineata]XP_023027014.1 lethal(3)malignant brain tumor-like protein 3 isoform X1 [Leptinotarsa decemlineata]XP_023027020.1 lethal(3)malignant brain tumor-like protein 3 isoform X1 [Leptinotarsa decemlineata]
MSSITSTELSRTQEELDNSKITINSNNSKIILENNSSDVTISKYEGPASFTNLPQTSSSSVMMKTQVLPVVYFQNSSKVPLSSVGKTNNVIVNNISQFQLASLAPNTNRTTTVSTAGTVSSNQNVIFTTGRPQSLVIQKPQGNLLPVVPVPINTTATKIASVLTVLKQTQKSSDSIGSNVNTIQINKTDINKLHDFPVINNNNTFIQPQNSSQKFILTPMPKLSSGAAVNSVQSKITLLPMPVPNSEPMVTKQRVYSNIKISDGQLQSDSTSITLMCDNHSNENSMDVDSNSENLVCDEVIDLDSSEKNDLVNKSYELSITEDSTSSQNELRTSVILSRPPTKELPKFSKHGVSILKKNYSFSERKVGKPNSLIITNSTSPISESKEISVSKPSTSETESVIVTVPAPSKPEKERRRKANFCYRKDFDEMEVTSNNSYGLETSSKPSYEITKCSVVTVDEPKKNLTSEVEIELIKEKPTLTSEECDLHKVLNWDDGIGTLPGTQVKFILNEFNLVEYITEEEFKAIIDKRIAKAKEKMKTDFPEEMRCLQCGCYGLVSDFINPKFCSYNCQESNEAKSKKEKDDKFKKKKKKLKDPSPETEKEEENEPVFRDFLQVKASSCPWTCKKKGFSWSKYLEHMKVKAAPVKLFKDPFPYTRNGFRPGMKLEGVDPQHPSYFCVFTVAETVGYRIRLHFDGYPDNYDFWCNADSMDIFPVGWCEKYGHVLQPPAGFTVENFNWIQYLKQTKAGAAPKHLFANRAGQSICPNGFRVGMKLEAVDRKNTSLVCVATIRDMMDNRILVHFDSWDDIYDYWADPTSPYIHPVGWCDQYGHNLTPPNDKKLKKIQKNADENLDKDYPNPESFSWEVYLKERKAVAAPVRAFKQRPACGFKRGMRLECVDKRVPQLIRVATVDDVKEHQIRIHFDGWIDRYSYWVDDDSPDIHPMGWCQKTGHPLEPPLTPDDVYDFLECPTVGCRGVGHIKGPKFATHSVEKNCPYAEDNVDAEKVLPDRLLSPDKSPEAVVPVSREPKECKIKPRVGRPPKRPCPESSKPVEPSEESEEPPKKKPKREHKKIVKQESMESPEEKAKILIEQSKLLPAERESWHQHSEFLKKYIKSESDPRFWSNREVVNFVSRIPCCGRDYDVFRNEKIDGEAFLSLSQIDLLNLLKMKVGPAIKLYNSIVLLRHHVDQKIYM